MMTDIYCDCCGGQPDGSKIYKVKYNFIMDTINNPKKLKEWLKGNWTFEKYEFKIFCNECELSWGIKND